MKFPLPADTFPPIPVSTAQTREVEAAAVAVVKNTMREYHEHLTVHNSVVDERRWRKIKQRNDVRVYQDRHPPPSELADVPELEADSLAITLAFGTMEGRLDDILYGMICPTTKEMQLKTAYVQNGFEDWKLILPVLAPTEDDPLRELNVKWIVKGHPSYVGMVMHARDVLYIEAIGLAQTPNGERVGYFVQHSVRIPEVRELDEYQVVRTRVSFCCIIRQLKDNVIEVYQRFVFSLMGNAPVSLGVMSAAEISLSLTRYLHVAEMKKLGRLVQQGAARCSALSDLGTEVDSKSSSSSTSSSSATSASLKRPAELSCAQCSQSIRSSRFKLPGASKEKHCRICLARVCSRCRVYKTLYEFVRTKELEATSMAFCTRCLVRIASASSTDFAVLDARAASGQSVDYFSALP